MWRKSLKKTELKYHLALVTGATSGIGKEIAHFFALKGIDLILSGRQQEKLQFLKDTLSTHVNVQIVEADFLKSEDRQRVIDIVHERTPDLVINSAGCGLYGDALTYTTEDQTNILQVNGSALLELTLEAARSLISREKKGVIFNISSASAFHVFPAMAVYAASKAFVNQFSLAFDDEVRKYGVRILTICPGMVATDFQKRAGGVKLLETQIGVMSPHSIVKQIWKQIEELNPLSIVDWKYRFLTFFCHFIPKSWIAIAERSIIEKRIPSRTLIKIEK